MLFVPAVADEQINEDEPLRLYPGGIEAEHQWFFRRRRRCNSYTTAFAWFDKRQVIDALEGQCAAEYVILKIKSADIEKGGGF